MISGRGDIDGTRGRTIGVQMAVLLCAIAIVAVLLVSLLMGLHAAGPGCDDILGCG